MKPNYENLIERNILTAAGRQNITIETAGVNKFNLNKELCKIGNKLSLDDGNIIIGSGVHHVLISGGGMMVVKSVGAKNIAITINNSEKLISMNSFDTISGFVNMHRAIPPQLIEVEENDEISLEFYGATGDIIANQLERTYVTV